MLFTNQDCSYSSWSTPEVQHVVVVCVVIDNVFDDVVDNVVDDVVVDVAFQLSSCACTRP